VRLYSVQCDGREYLVEAERFESDATHADFYIGKNLVRRFINYSHVLWSTS
jgi:hypothetical protein